MKHLTEQDLYLLVKLVNQQDEVLAHAADVTAMIRRQDRHYKSLPPESLDESNKLVAPVEHGRRRMQLLRSRLLAELTDK